MDGDYVSMDISQLVADHHQAVFRYAYRLTGSVPDAEDLTQQVFLKAQERLHQLRRAGSARSWLFAILRNHFIKACQKRSPIPAADLSLEVDTIAAEIRDNAAVDRERLQSALHQLTPRYRLILTMFYYEGCSYREIAEQLDIPMGTVMSRLARAKGRLRSKLFESAGRTAGGREKTIASRRA